MANKNTLLKDWGLEEWIDKKEESKGEDSKETIAVAGNQEGSSEGTEASTDQVSQQDEENNKEIGDEEEREDEQEEGSHRARLLSNAKRCGLRLRSDVQGDGNCYFRALADQLARIGVLECVKTTSHEVLRAEICDYMQHNPIPEMGHHVSKEYISNMRQNHKWAGEPEIVATMKKYGVNMRVVTAWSPTNGFCMHHFQEENATETLYLGHIHENQYVSLEPDDDQDQYLTKDLGAPSSAISSAGKLKVSHGGTDATPGGPPTKSCVAV